MADISTEQNLESIPASDKKSGGIAYVLGKIDSAGETGMRKLRTNMWCGFLRGGLAALHIANNLLA